MQPNPSGRRSIHDKKPLNEIKDNVKNDAIVTRSKTQKKIQKKATGDKSDENGFSAQSSDEDFGKELLDLTRRRRLGSSSQENETHSRNENQQRRSTSSSSGVDSSPSWQDKSSKNLVSESSINYQESQQKRKGRSDGLTRLREKENLVRPERKESKCNCLSLFVSIIVAIIAIAIFLKYYPGDEQDINVNVLTCVRDDVNCTTENVKQKLKTMKRKYTHQDDDLWRNVYVGIKSIIEKPQKPSIILLLGNRTDPLDCLAVLLGDVSRSALHSGLLKLTPEKFENDMGSVITSLRSSIKDKKAVVSITSYFIISIFFIILITPTLFCLFQIIWDLLNINEEALKAFHNLCDRINPLVEEVIYIITIIADDFNESSKPLEFVERKLYEKLSGKMKEDAIQPLITRITDGPILIVNPEPDLTDCPLPRMSK